MSKKKSKYRTAQPASPSGVASNSQSQTQTASASDLLIFHTLEPTHCGSGESGDGVDKLILRDKTTSWPIFSPESIKGMLRGVCVEQQFRKHKGTRSRSELNENDETINDVFGPWNVDGPESAFAGAIQPSTAHILAFPVASHPGVFTWITCPEVIRVLRGRLDAFRLQSSGKPPEYFPAHQGDEFFHALTSDSPVKERRIGRHDFKRQDHSCVKDVVGWFAKLASHEHLKDEILKKRLVVVSDEVFSYFAKYELQVSMHNSLDYDTKTVIDGRLFSIENLPAETLMYAPITANASRLKTAGKVLEHVRGAVTEQNNVIQIGAGASTAHGTCYLKWTGN